MKFYKFKKELEEGVVVARPNRFIMEVIIGGKKEKAHCPVTGRIGNFDFKETPCLLSFSDNPKRKTSYTVEAISPQKADSKKKKWIGINQGKSNSYAEFFIRNDFMRKMIKNGKEIKREKKLGNSRIDFQVENNFIEVKTMVGNIPYGKKKENFAEQSSLDRLIKHFSDLAKFSKQKKGKAIVLMCNQYNAEVFHPPKNASKSKIGKTVEKALKDGVENWQLNLKIDKKGVYFLEYFKLDILKDLK